MAEVKWIKIVTDIFDDDKILLIESMPEADAIIVIWFKLLCLAGKQNNSGVFLLNGRIAYTDEMFATIFRRPLNTVRLALKTFEQFGMIEIVNDTITIPNWGKHQNFDKIEARNEYMRGYMKEYREKQKQLLDGKSNGKANSKSNVSEADKNRLEESRLEGEVYNGSRKRFTAPTVEEVSAYALEKGYDGFSAERFVDYYTSKGWVVGKSPMKDWKAAVRNWAARDKGEAKPQQGRPEGWHNPALDYAQRDYKSAAKDKIGKTLNMETGEWE